MVNCTASKTESFCIHVVMGLALDEYTIHGNDRKVVKCKRVG